MSDDGSDTDKQLGGIADRFARTRSAASEAEGHAENEASDEAVDATESERPAEEPSTGESTAPAERTRSAGSSDDAGSASRAVNVKEDWNGRTIYLSDELLDQVEAKYVELYAAFRREHRREMKKNRDFYPALFRAALGESSVEAELGLE